MDIIGIHLEAQHGGDRLRLGDLLGLQALAFQHIVEIHVAAEVQLVGMVQVNPALLEQGGQDAVRNGGANLALDIVADDRQAAFGKTLLPVRLGSNEDRDAVDETAAGFQNLFHIPLGGFFRTNRQVADHHIGLRVLKDFDNVCSGAVGFLDHFTQILAYPVMGHATLDFDSHMRHIRELDRVVRKRRDGLAQIQANFGIDYIEGSRKFNVMNVIPAQVDMHQAGDSIGFTGVFIELDALHQ